MKTPNSISLALIILFLMAGCKTNQHLTINKQTETSAETTVNFIDEMRKQAFDFQTISAKTNMEFRTDEQELASRVDIKMVKDSIIQFSIQPILGFEVARIEFGMDSIKMMDRANKQFLLENYKNMKLQTQMDLNFFIIQALISNRIFTPDETDANATLNRFKLTQDGELAKAQIKGSGQTVYSFTAERSLRLLSTIIRDAATQYSLKWNYSDFKIIEGKSFPMQMNLQLDENEKVALDVKISFAKIQTNMPVNADFSIPKNYKRVNLNELAKNLGIK